MAKAKTTAAKKTAPKKTVQKEQVEDTDVLVDEKDYQDPSVTYEEPDSWEIKDRLYRLVGNKTPLVETMPSRHSAGKPLLYFDEDLGYSRELRYATNQKSVFVDEQEGHATLAHIIFRNGTLFVPRTKQNLQKLLSLYHPLIGTKFIEVNNRKMAEDQLGSLDLEYEALTLSRNLDIDHLEAILRVEYGNKVNSMESSEIKRDVMLFAKRNPGLFINLAKDENVALRNFGIKSVEAGLIKLSQDQRSFLWASNGRKLFNIPFDENPYSALAAWFKTDDGVEVYQNIEKRLK